MLKYYRQSREYRESWEYRERRVVWTKMMLKYVDEDDVEVCGCWWREFDGGRMRLIVA